MSRTEPMEYTGPPELYFDLAPIMEEFWATNGANFYRALDEAHQCLQDHMVYMKRMREEDENALYFDHGNGD